MRNKHVDERYPIRRKAINGEFELEYCPNFEMIADMLGEAVKATEAFVTWEVDATNGIDAVSWRYLRIVSV